MISELISGLYLLHQDMHTALATTIRGLASGSVSAVTPVVFAIALGALHALTPGHGKSIVVSYFLGREAKLVAGIAVGLKIAAGHVLLAAALVAVFGAAVSMMGRPAGAAATLQTFAYVVIAASGAWLLYKSLRPRHPKAANSDRHHTIPALAGLIPCPLTMLLLTYALATTSLTVSILLIAALGVGIAGTIALFGLMAILARKVLLAPIDPERGWYALLSKALEVASSGFICLIGLALVLGVRI